jgi:hypothetical protein
VRFAPDRLYVDELSGELFMTLPAATFREHPYRSTGVRWCVDLLLRVRKHGFTLNRMFAPARVGVTVYPIMRLSDQAHFCVTAHDLRRMELVFDPTLGM